jgi:hypothetical protein
VGLAEQERALFALVFDPSAREDFLADPRGALARLGVPAHEHEDFLSLSRFGLQVDARDREVVVLGRLARSFPLTISAVSAFDEGLARVRALVGVGHFAVPADERPARFGAALLACVSDLDGPTVAERGLLLAVARWEATLAHLGASARAAARQGEQKPEPASTDAPPADWEDRPLALAPYLAVVRMPVSLSELTRALLPCRAEALWAHVRQSPLPRDRVRRAAASKGEGWIALGRAVVVHASTTDAEVIHRTVELAAGFEAFLARIDGRRTARTLLQAFVSAGAPPRLVEGVRAGLLRLVREDMLRLR